MRSKNAPRHTTAEQAHMAAVKSVGCVLCDAPAPNQAHHSKQRNHFTTVALCANCHSGAMGWHGDKTMFRIYKMDENDCLNETIRRVKEWQG
jgi:hypothetical protein